MKLADIVVEGPNDPHIFKAVFLAGGPGSGKSYVSSKLLAGTGLRVVNSDDIYEYMMSKQGMALDPETIFSPAGQETREKAKAITGRKKASHIDGRLGLIIDGTGKDVAKYKKQKEMLESLGYETMMLFVNTSLDVAQERNLQRARSLDPKAVDKMWNAVQQNIGAFQNLFGAGNFHIVDNSGGLEDPERKANFENISKAIRKFLNAPPRRPAAKQWLAAQKTGASVSEDITQTQLNALEAAIDRVFGKLGIDVEFTRHFLDRVNDERNVKPITIRELGQLFAKEYQRWGRTIANMPIDSQAVMKDLSSEINIPFVLNKDGKEKDLVAKTVMRKKNFTTPNKELPVESVNKDTNRTTNDSAFVRQFAREKRSEGWNVYLSKKAFRTENDYMLEFEKGGYEFYIIGSDGHWELFYGPTPSGRGEVFDGVDTAFQTAEDRM